MTKSELLGKVIKEINLDGNGIWLMTEDGYCLDYSSSDGGYSSWELSKNEASEVECMEVPKDEQEMKCSCFREQYGKTVCYGTKEIDPCSCDGDESKCSFYPEVRARAVKPMTNADRIRAMTDEELAELLLDGCRGSKCEDQPQNAHGSVNCYTCRLNWLKQPVEV